MNLVDLAGEIVVGAQTITGLRVHTTPGNVIAPPAFVLGFPESITFDATYGRGSDRLTLPGFLLVGRTSERSGGLDLLRYLSGSGPKSIKAALESATYTAADSVHVATASVGALSSGGVEYLGATFEIMIMGRGTT